jgi:glycosyltransferase involved in cell wall biosynthesis
VGRLIKRKGIEFLLEAFAKANKQLQKKYQVWLVGEGPERRKLQLLAEKLQISQSIKFLGIKNKEELVMIYNRAKIFVLPSLNEGMSNALLEAMACGLPIIISNVGGSSQLIKGNGLVVRKGSALDIKNTLEKYGKNNLLMFNHGQKSREIAKKLTWETVAKQYLSFYQKSFP